ncbi:MAG TPA: glycogen debranching N-terminal domain-containing protein [Candidatus Dormibacteraeota bacterium]|nr:glycogen debranching N-terminal domain-containing protein [Candidatus Dormibacteraeota bacterium]
MISAGQLIAERVMLKQDSCFAVSARDGSIRSGEFSGDGLWLGDTRILSSFRLLVDGLEPAATGLDVDDGWALFTLSAGALTVTRHRFVDAGLRERITFTNPSSIVVDAVVEIEAAADFAAMLAIRGIVPDLPAPVPARASKTVEGIRFEGDGGVEYASRVIAFPEGLKHQLRLRPGETFTWLIEVVPESAPKSIDFDAGIRAAGDVYPRWASECMNVRTDNPLVNEVLDRAIKDIRMLCNRYDTGIFPTGGLPWYAVPFARDTLICSMQLLPVNPAIAAGVLRYLAKRQGKKVNLDSEEQPGKILHEVRSGEVVERGLWPPVLFGTIDASALFVCTLGETESWTKDMGLVDELWPAAEKALEWCVNYGDLDGDGYIEYRGARARNQGWKDSDDSLTHTDGTDASRPAALCEVQAYLYRAMTGMSSRRPELKHAAAELKRRFNEDFWMADERFVAQALDGSKLQVKAITSNPGHCLWMGILPPARAGAVAKRLASPELFSGWGVRTLSDRAVNYDPSSYHNGSVWPFDGALAAAGMRRYGFVKEAELIARALFESAIAFPLRRPPELFCGDEREEGRAPNLYWNTCTPQLWSAAAMFTLVSSLLGLQADAKRGTLRLAPVETQLWSRVEVSGLHFAGERVDFAVHGTQVKLGRVPSGVNVVTQSLSR